MRLRGAFFHAIELKRSITISLLVVITLAVYCRVWTFGFVMWDDDVNVYGNVRFQEDPLGSIPLFWKQQYEHLWIPLTYTAWAVLAAVAALPEGQFDQKSAAPVQAPFDPVFFHGANVFLHIFAVLLVYAILRRLLGKQNEIPAALGAALFAVHPLQVEVVAWVTGLKDLLAWVLSLGAIAAYLEFVAKAEAAEPGPGEGIEGNWRRELGSLAVRGSVSFAVLGSVVAAFYLQWLSITVALVLGALWLAVEAGWRVRQRRSLWFLLSTLAYLLALLAKPSTVVVPAIAFVLEVVMLRRSWIRSAERLYPWVYAALVLTVVTFFAQSGGQFKFEPPPLWIRPVIALDAIAFYLWKTVLPVGLGPEYGRSPDWLLSHKWMLLATAIVPLVLGLLAWRRREQRAYAAGLLVFVLALLPLLGLVPFAYQGVSTVADRYAYVALLGAALAVAAMLAESKNRLACPIALAVVSIFAVATFLQTRFWRNTDVLFARGIELNPRSWLLIYNQGVIANEIRNFEVVEEKFKKAVELWPDYVDALNNLGTEYGRQGRIAEAMVFWRKAVDVDPGHAVSLRNLTNELISQKRYDEAVALTIACYKRLPYVRTKKHLASVYWKIGGIFFNDKQYEAALPRLKKAFELDSTDQYRQTLAHGYNNMAAVMTTQGKHQEAVPLLIEACRLDPSNIDAVENLAVTFRNAGRYREALEVFERYFPVLGDRPHYQFIYAVTLGNLGRIPESLAMAEQALERARAEEHPREDLMRQITGYLESVRSQISGNRDPGAP